MTCLTTESVWWEVSFHAVLLTPWFAHWILLSAECRPCLDCTLVSVMDSKLSMLPKEWEDSRWDGFQPWLDTLPRDSVNSVSTRSSRMFTETLLVRMSLNIEPSVSPSLQLVPSSLLISFSAHGKLSKLECKLLPQELRLEVELKCSETFNLLRDRLVFTEVLNHFGWDRFHTPLLSSLLSKRLYRLSILIYLLRRRTHTAREPKWWSPLLLVISLVFSALSFLTQLIPWSLSWTKLDRALVRSTLTLVSMVSGRVSELEFSWSVLLPASSGSSTIHSRLLWVFRPLVESEITHTTFWHWGYNI